MKGITTRVWMRSQQGNNRPQTIEPSWWSSETALRVTNKINVITGTTLKSSVEKLSHAPHVPGKRMCICDHEYEWGRPHIGLRMTPREALVDEPESEERCIRGDASRCCPLPQLPLAIIFDLDGTLVAERDSDDYDDDDGRTEQFWRAGALEFVDWCHQRGHQLAIWTAAHASWAYYVQYKMEQQLCQAKFVFCWAQPQLWQRQRIPVSVHGEEMGCCRWCGPYRHNCDRCECTSSVYHCPCRYTKNLQKVWKRNIRTFNKQRTLLIENTPQQCIRNYGNAIYVPTYDGDPTTTCAQVALFERLKQLIVRLEQVDDVRTVAKCCHEASQGPHACWEQSWWHENVTTCRPVQTPLSPAVANTSSSSSSSCPSLEPSSESSLLSQASWNSDEEGQAEEVAVVGGASVVDV